MSAVELKELERSEFSLEVQDPAQNAGCGSWGQRPDALGGGQLSPCSSSRTSEGPVVGISLQVRAEHQRVSFRWLRASPHSQGHFSQLP